MFCLQGTITSLGDEEGVISSADHGDIPFDTCENFSDTEFNPDDVGKEVEFTVMAVSVGTGPNRSHDAPALTFASCRGNPTREPSG